MASEAQNPIPADAESKLHIALVPWLAFGHMLPFLELSKSLAQRGHKVSFISTQKNVDRLPKIPPNLASSITFVKFSLPQVQGLPENAEATMDVHTDDVPHLKTAFDGLESELTRILENSSPDLLIYDFAPYWLPPVATKLGIPRAFFCAFNAWFLGFLGPTDVMLNISLPRIKIEDFLVAPPWVSFETKVAYKPYEIIPIFKSAMERMFMGVSDSHRTAKSIIGADAIIIRHCHEFEGNWLKLVEELYKKPVVPLGLLPPPPPTEEVSSGGDDEVDETWDTIKRWLDRKDKGSVVYVALGSERPLSQAELTELALGLELSGVPFFWALRNPAGSNPVELPEGLEERIKDRGMVRKSWVPQVKILSHVSVGGFLTHCGWNSITEGLTFGHPLIMLPFLIDQGLNARVLEENQVGKEVPRNEWEGTYTKESVAESVKLIMIEDEGKKLRDKAKDMKGIFGDTKLHNSYMQKAIEFLEGLAGAGAPKQ